MSKIKERDILKLLQGKASPKKLKALESWSSKDPENARALELYQKIYDEADHLSSYDQVDVDAEWANFRKSGNTDVTDQELLQYLDGMSIADERKRVDEWRKTSVDNEKDIEIFNLILKESSQLSNYKKVNTDDEWDTFSQRMKKPASAPLSVVRDEDIPAQKIEELQPISHTDRKEFTPAVAHSGTIKKANEISLVADEQKKERSGMPFMWRTLAVAASILLLSVFAWSLWQNTFNSSSLDQSEQFLTYSTEDYPEVITISDGTIIALDERTTLTYFKDVNEAKERSVIIDGTGEFNVASMPDKPFVVKAKRSGVGIRVLGTKFRFKNSDTYKEVIENIEGSVRAYSLNDTSTYVIMTAGDKYGFDGVQFVDLRDIDEDYNGQEYDILYVLDYLMEESNWKVTTLPYMEFTEDAMIKVDLEKPYEEILEDLARRENFEYIKMPCEGCYQVTKFVAK